MPLLELKNVSFSYGQKNILDQINLQIDNPSIIGLVAPNGSGKSTFLNLIAGTLVGFQGEMSYQEIPFTRKLNPTIKQDIVKMPDQADLLNELSGRDHLNLYAGFWKRSPKELDAVISLLQMESYVSNAVGSYSLGMRQRLAFAMCLVTDAKILLLDEVMNSLDPSNVALISQILKDLVTQGKLILLVSHILDNLEVLSDKVLFLKNGNIQLVYCPQEAHSNLVEITFYPSVGERIQKDFLEQQVLSHQTFHETISFDVGSLSKEQLKAWLLELVEQTNLFSKISIGRKSCQLIYHELYARAV